LAAGTEFQGDDAYILFWDVRDPSLIQHRFEECHSDDVTQVKFHPTDPNAMISGSTDGLVCLYNLADMNEDEALYQVIKDESTHKIGYFGPSFEYLYILTHMETFSIHTFLDSEKICHYGDVRAVTPDLTLDYCIDCVFDVDSSNLFVLGGSQNGSIGILNVTLKGLELAYTLNGGHSDIVRGIAWDIKVLPFLT
jgi:WD40 repeat protein